MPDLKEAALFSPAQCLILNATLQHKYSLSCRCEVCRVEFLVNVSTPGAPPFLAKAYNSFLQEYFNFDRISPQHCRALADEYSGRGVRLPCRFKGAPSSPSF